MPAIEISTESEKLDLQFISNYIADSYWAKGRTQEEMKICIDNSLNFGIYKSGKQIGYARIVTDYVQFAYLMDLFVHESYQRKGYAKQLMKFILDYQQLSLVKVWRLATSDAHALYSQFGFTPLTHPEKMMEFLKN